MRSFRLPLPLFLGVLVFTTVSCTTILGIDGDFKPASGAGGTTSSTALASTTASAATSGTTTGSTSTGGGGGMGPLTITGSQRISRVTPSLGPPKAVDFTQDGHTILAYALAGDTYTSYPGSGDSQGHFTIEGVPAGPYVLNVDGHYYALDNRSDVTLDLTFNGYAGEVLNTSMSTLYSLSATGLVPWATGDQIEFFSGSAGVAGRGVVNTFSMNNPIPGDTSLDITDKYYFVASPGNLLTTSDTLLFDQLVSTGSPQGLTYQTVGASGVAHSTEMVDGATTGNVLSGQLSSPGPATSFLLEWMLSDFDYASTVTGGTAVGAATMTIEAIPGGQTSLGYFGPTTDLLLANPVNEIHNDMISFNTPASFGAAWLKVLTFKMSYVFPLSFQTATVNSAFTGSLISRDVVPANNQAVNAEPIITPVRSVTVDGNPGFGPSTAITKTPLIAWSAPSIGTPTNYSIRVFRLAVNGTNTKEVSVANILTDKTSVRIPPDNLSSGQSYTFLITAHSYGGVDYQTTPTRLGFPEGAADMATAAFSVN